MHFLLQTLGTDQVARFRWGRWGSSGRYLEILPASITRAWGLILRLVLKVAPKGGLEIPRLEVIIQSTDQYCPRLKTTQSELETFGEDVE